MRRPARRLRGWFLPVLVAGSLTGCAMSFDATQLGVPVTMASAASQPAQGDKFELTSRAMYGFWGLVKFKQPSLEQALASQLVGGAGVADLKISVKSGFSDVLLTILTAGIIVPRAVKFEGVIVK